MLAGVMSYDFFRGLIFKFSLALPHHIPLENYVGNTGK